jgi:hypothetical protein
MKGPTVAKAAKTAPKQEEHPFVTELSNAINVLSGAGEIVVDGKGAQQLIYVQIPRETRDSLVSDLKKARGDK